MLYYFIYFLVLQEFITRTFIKITDKTLFFFAIYRPNAYNNMSIHCVFLSLKYISVANKIP